MEKRNYQRVNFCIEAHLKYRNLNYKGVVRNLSLKGALIETFECLDIEINTKIKVSLLITDSSSEYEINFEGIVVRNLEHLIGFKIDDIELDSFINLRNVVAYNCGDYDKIMEEFINNYN